MTPSKKKFPLTPELREVARVLAGLHPRSEVRNVPDGSHWLVQPRDLAPDHSSVDASTLVRISPPSDRKDQELKDGDILFMAKGTSHFALAPAGLPRPSLAHSAFFVIRPSEQVCTDYLVWFLNLPRTRQHFARLATGRSWAPVIRKDVVASLRLLVPSLAVQRDVAELDALSRMEQDLLRRYADTRKDFLTEICLDLAHGR